MAFRIKDLQRSDGLWSPSLLDSEEDWPRESSGTALFCYALTWGLNQGILNKDIFFNTIERAWIGLNHSVSIEGKLCWVQQSASEPKLVKESDFQEYGAGAFLLAASEIYKMIL